MAYTTIDKPSDYFETKLWSGNATDDRAISGLDFAPNWVWIKNRTDSNSHAIFDTVRGATKYIESDTSDAEATGATFLKSFTSDGFTLGTAGRVNANSQNYVSWNWKAGTSVSGNTGGSGTAKTYTGSVNTDAGFSIIRYIGNSTAGHTIPHHLGTTPAWVIARTISAAKEWDVYHHKNTSSPETDYLVLNTTAATTDASDKWNDTAPTSSVVTLGDSSQLNTNDGTCIMYAFAEKKGYSKFGSYVANGDASNNTFIYTGFKVGWVLIKRSSSSGEGWFIFDSTRSPANLNVNELRADTSSAETTGSHYIDFLSNGFKPKTNGAGIGGSGDTYIYMAFAESPFVTGASAIPTTAR